LSEFVNYQRIVADPIFDRQSAQTYLGELPQLVEQLLFTKSLDMKELRWNELELFNFLELLTSLFILIFLILNLFLKLIQSLGFYEILLHCLFWHLALQKSPSAFEHYMGTLQRPEILCLVVLRFSFDVFN